MQLHRLPTANVARHDEVMRLVEQQRLYGLGLSYVDVHLLAAARLTAGGDRSGRGTRRLSAAAEQLSLAARVTH